MRVPILENRLRCSMALFGACCGVFCASAASAESVGGVSGGGVTIAPYRIDGTPLLDSFYLRYNDSDHHVESLRVEPRPLTDSLFVSLADVNGDDDYYYSVEHRDSLDTGITANFVSGFCRGSCLLPLTPPPNSVFVLTGFSFQFTNGDHHLDRIGIVREGNSVRTYFDDENDDDEYVVTVGYAWIPAIRATPSRVSGTATGATQVPMTNGPNTVISGFFFNYDDPDHHLREIGVLTGTTDLQLFYADRNADDSFTYTVDLTLLTL